MSATRLSSYSVAGTRQEAASIMDGFNPERGFRVTLILADAAQVAEGKLNVLGGGWNEIGPQPTPFAVAGIIEVPWNLANQPHTFRLELIDLDGNPVLVPTPTGSEPFALEGGFEVGRPPGTPPGTSLPFSLAMNVGPVPLPVDSRFEWRLLVDGECAEDWRLAFRTRPAQSLPRAA